MGKKMVLNKEENKSKLGFLSKSKEINVQHFAFKLGFIEFYWLLQSLLLKQFHYNLLLFKEKISHFKQYLFWLKMR